MKQWAQSLENMVEQMKMKMPQAEEFKKNMDTWARTLIRTGIYYMTNQVQTILSSGLNEGYAVPLNRNVKHLNSFVQQLSETLEQDKSKGHMQPHIINIQDDRDQGNDSSPLQSPKSKVT